MKTKLATLLALSALLLPSTGMGAPQADRAKKSKPAESEEASSPSSASSAEKESKAPKDATIPRKQAEARELAASLTPTQRSRILALLNEGSASDLAQIKGVSKTRAAAIEKARPFDSVDHVILISGIGKGTFAEMINHARGLTTAKKKATAASPPAAEKKS